METGPPQCRGGLEPRGARTFFRRSFIRRGEEQKASPFWPRGTREGEEGRGGWGAGRQLAPFLSTGSGPRWGSREGTRFPCEGGREQRCHLCSLLGAWRSRCPGRQAQEVGGAVEFPLPGSPTHTLGWNTPPFKGGPSPKADPTSTRAQAHGLNCIPLKVPH